MSPRLLGSFEYGRPSPAIRRTDVGFIISGTLSVAVRLLSVGTLIVTPPRIAYRNLHIQYSQHHRVGTSLGHGLTGHQSTTLISSGLD